MRPFKLHWVLAGLCVWSCTQPVASNRANLVGTQDLVLADELSSTGTLAGSAAEGGTVSIRGMPARFLFMTSADTGELRVLENYREVSAGRGFVKAPNPLESLSIPVLDRPTLLAVDEGRNAAGARVTGSYVYASRPGALEVSVVSVRRLRQLGGHPMATPGPVTAIAAFMDVDTTQPVLNTPLPATTTLFVATWDGHQSHVYRSTLPTDSREFESLSFERLFSLTEGTVAAMMAVAPVQARVVDGQAFCASSVCLAMAVRGAAAGVSETFLYEPQTERSVPLDFGGPVKELTGSADHARVYALLDEEACGGAPCGGVMAVDVTQGTLASGFSRAKDAMGQPWQPLRWGQGLLTGLTVAAGGAVRMPREALNSDGTIGLTYELQSFTELGAVATSAGTVTLFSARGGGIIDFDPRRSEITQASTHLPLALSDGGVTFLGEDGGFVGSVLDAGVQVEVDLEKTWRVSTVTEADSTVWTADVSDGYLDSQSVRVVNRGLIPGLAGLSMSIQDGLSLSVPSGFEARAAAGDVVIVEHQVDGVSRPCGRAEIVSASQGKIQVDALPTTCAAPSAFSVRAAGNKPLVVVADLDGYLGRTGWGETFSYSRRHILLPAGAVAPRAALTLMVPRTGFSAEGAYLQMEVLGHLTPYQMALDTAGTNTGIGCYAQLPTQVVLGNLVMASVPTSLVARGPIEYKWSMFIAVPSGNGVAEISQALGRPGSLGLGDGANCWR